MIRAAVPADAGDIAAIYGGYVGGGTISFEDFAPDPAGMAARMAEGAGLYPWLVVDEGAEVAAYAYASAWSARSAYRWTVETTIYVTPGAQRRGIGRALYAALLKTLRTQGFHQAIGRISLPNPPSEALHAALGFTCAGTMPRVGWKHGRWIDVAHWQRPLAEPANPPAEPSRFADAGRTRPA